MDAGRLRRESGSLSHSFHGQTRVMAVAVRGFQAYFDVLLLVLNIICYGEDRRELCTALGGEAFSTLKRRSLAMPGFFHGNYFDADDFELMLEYVIRDR
jgi:hypothetical protein